MTKVNNSIDLAGWLRKNHADQRGAYALTSMAGVDSPAMQAAIDEITLDFMSAVDSPLTAVDIYDQVEDWLTETR